MNPPHPVVSPAYIRAVVELDTKEKAVQNKMRIKTLTLLKVWPLCKFVNYDTKMGQRIKKMMQTELGMQDHAFENG